MTNTETLVIGAGPAGLAVAAGLKTRGRPFLLVEQADRPAHSWRHHYDRLHLHTHRRHSALPGLAFERSSGAFPSRQSVVRYLDRYVDHFALQPQLGVAVRAIKPVAGGWQVSSDAHNWLAERVVMATGYTRVENWPHWPGMDSSPFEIVHSGDYQSPAHLAGQRVLVVGMGNSGAEIAMDLCLGGRDVTVAVRGGVNVVPRQIAGIPIATINRLSHWLPSGLNEKLARWSLARRYGDLPALGLAPLPYSAQCQMTEHQKVPLIDIGTIDLIRRKQIAVKPGIRRQSGAEVTFDDGSEAQFDHIVVATGFRPRLDELLGDCPGLDSEGTPKVSGQQLMPGLFLCGFRVSPRGMLYEIGREAQAIASAIQGMA